MLVFNSGRTMQRLVVSLRSMRAVVDGIRLVALRAPRAPRETRHDDEGVSAWQSTE